MDSTIKRGNEIPGGSGRVAVVNAPATSDHTAEEIWIAYRDYQQHVSCYEPSIYRATARAIWQEIVNDIGSDHAREIAESYWRAMQ